MPFHFFGAAIFFVLSRPIECDVRKNFLERLDNIGRMVADIFLIFFYVLGSKIFDAICL